MCKTTTLNQDWKFAQLSEQTADDWLPVTQFPTSVHVELLKAGRIPDPVSMHDFYLGISFILYSVLSSL